MGFLNGPFGSGIILGSVPLLNRSGNPLGSTTSATAAVVWVQSLLSPPGPNDRLTVLTQAACTASSNNKTMSIRLGTNADGITGSTQINTVSSTASSVILFSKFSLQNLAALNAQARWVSEASSGYATPGLAVDFSTPLYLSVTLLAAGGETVSLQVVQAWIERGTA